MKNPVILVVDDEAVLRILAADHFAEAGFEVVEASNGAEALKVMRKRPDIKAIVTDVQMPGEPDGFTLSHAIREICPNCAIVVVSGKSMPAGGDLADRARFVPKPYRGEEVVRLVEELLANLG